MEVQIRAGREEDLPRLVDIYNHYVRHGHVVFDTEPATVGSRREWFAEFTGARHQILVAEGRDGVLGCATSRRYRSHPAFDGTVETGIYLDLAARGQGIGGRLYDTLLGVLEHHGVHMAVAGVALPNEASVALHRRLGFREVGVFHDYALKHGVPISSVWFQRPIAPAPDLEPCPGTSAKVGIGSHYAAFSRNAFEASIAGAAGNGPHAEGPLASGARGKRDPAPATPPAGGPE